VNAPSKSGGRWTSRTSRSIFHESIELASRASRCRAGLGSLRIQRKSARVQSAVG
jgi:hypothetical protein